MKHFLYSVLITPVLMVFRFTSFIWLLETARYMVACPDAATRNMGRWRLEDLRNRIIWGPHFFLAPKTYCARQLLLTVDRAARKAVFFGDEQKSGEAEEWRRVTFYEALDAEDMLDKDLFLSAPGVKGKTAKSPIKPTKVAAAATAAVGASMGNMAIQQPKQVEAIVPSTRPVSDERLRQMELEKERRRHELEVTLYEPDHPPVKEDEEDELYQDDSNNLDYEDEFEDHS